MTNCIGITEKRQTCNQPTNTDSKFCQSHIYQKDFTQEIIEGILNNTMPKYKCGKGNKICKHWHCEEGSNCLQCQEFIKMKNFKKKCLTEGCKYQENLKKGNGYCGVCDESQMKKKEIINQGMKICSRWHHSSKCLEKLHINDPNESCEECRKSQRVKSNQNLIVIKKKAEELNVANSEILNLVEKQRKNKNITTQIETKINSIKQKQKQNQNNSVDNKINENINMLSIDTPCTEDFLSDSSDYFVEDKSDDDKTNLIDSNTNLTNNKINLIDETKYFRICTNKNCKKTYDLTHFVGPNLEITVECNFCREKNKKQTEGRIRKNEKEHNIDFAKQKERLERKKINKTTNTELMALKYKLEKLNQIEKLGENEYYKKQAENAQKYRNNNKEKMEFLNIVKKLNPNERLKYYKRRSTNKNIKWTISDDHAMSLFKNPCYYCGEFDKSENDGSVVMYEKYVLNGIDRLNNEVGYESDNVVPCCKMCNFMKCEIDHNDYVKIVRHIFENVVGSINNKPYTCNELFSNYGSIQYHKYLQRANDKNISFYLTPQQFKIITCLECYMCGKTTNENHMNGIDRIDNKNGYNIANCLACCGTCNYLKNKFDIFKIFEKIHKTVEIHHNLKISLNINDILKKYLDSYFDITKCIINKSTQLTSNMTTNLEIKNNQNIDEEYDKLIKIKKNNTIQIDSKKDNINDTIEQQKAIRKNDVKQIDFKKDNINDTKQIDSKKDNINGTIEQQEIIRKKIQALKKTKSRALLIGDLEKIKKVEEEISEIMKIHGNNIKKRERGHKLLNECPSVELIMLKINYEQNQRNNKNKSDDFAKTLRGKPNDQKLKLSKQHAIQMNVKWTIDDKNAFVHYNSDCYYCREKDNIIISRKTIEDSYNFENCIPCCETCHVMKNDHSFYDFICIAKHILTKFYKHKNFNCWDLFKSYCYDTFEESMNKAAKNNLIFELNQNQFETIQKMNCCLCNRKQIGNNKHYVGMIDNSLGYVLDNCLPYCHICMKLKDDYNVSTIIRKLSKFLFFCCHEMEYFDVCKNNNEFIKIFEDHINLKKTDVAKNIFLLSNKNDLLKNNKTELVDIKPELSKLSKKEHIEPVYNIHAYRRIMALEKQITKAKKNEDNDLVSKLKNEIKDIQNGNIKPEKRMNLTVEEKRENERIRKARYRAKNKSQK